jgi:ribonuclease BN (tRNA processing enzyme)
MKITVIGCGNMSSYKNYNQSFLLDEGNSRLLVDCGSKVPWALHDAGIPIKSITHIYVSHDHGDHCGGLQELGFMLYDWMGKPKRYDSPNRTRDYAPKLIANEVLMKDLWNHTLSGGMSSVEGFDASLASYFEVVPLEANQSFDFEGWRCSLVQQVHVMTGSVIKWTFGLFVEKEGHKSVYFTTDTQYFQPEQVLSFYKKADIIFQDCECIGCNTATKRMHYKSGAHANYGQLAGWEGVNVYRMDEDVKKKLWLSHYDAFVSECTDDAVFGNACDRDALAEEDGFAGFVHVGQEFNI